MTQEEVNQALDEGLDLDDVDNKQQEQRKSSVETKADTDESASLYSQDSRISDSLKNDPPMVENNSESGGDQATELISETESIMLK